MTIRPDNDYLRRFIYITIIMTKEKHEVIIEYKIHCKYCGYITNAVNPLAATLIAHEHQYPHSAIQLEG